ncbi:unnamed protein product [Dimorphilus gyrociliatus]|uniref:Uncharacterized protein n=1 Tax=Dimorphilus gyrociliatus TaxID=2664684 RepID=A0A7I8W5C1_9ANNE|nr:unnamed protein product [Dimorphilus gyrociliatus]
MRRISARKGRSIAMISDSDGKHYPWYGAKTEMKTIRGPTTKPTEVTVVMDDNFFPNVTWYIPEHTWGKQPRLQHIYRKQHFLTSLALRINSKIHVIKTIAWHMEIEIDVNPEKRQASLVGPYYQDQPELLKEAVKISRSALNPPNANNCQTLIWRPFKPELGSPTIIVPPKDFKIPIDQYLSETKDKIRHFHNYLPLHHVIHNYVEPAEED